MATKHPYISSGGPLIQAVTQFRKSFPATVDAGTLKKLGIASNNESYLINILKFLSLIDDSGNRTEKSASIFVLHKDEDFYESFSEVVKSAYSDLFDLHHDSAWALDDENLITYFRQADQSTEIVGKRQAMTFRVLAGLSGKRELSSPRTTNSKRTASESTKKVTSKQKSKITPAEQTATQTILQSTPQRNEGAFGLTVRVEINLPTDGSQATYDRIFKSIKENLIDAYKS